MQGTPLNTKTPIPIKTPRKKKSTFVEEQKTIVQGVDLSGVERVSKYKQDRAEARDVLEIYDDKMRETQYSFNKPPPSTHESTKGFGAFAYQSFYNGNGKYSEETHQLVNYYLSQKPDYDSRKFEFFNEEEAINRDRGRYFSKTTEDELADILQQSRNLQGPREGSLLANSVSLKDLNTKIRHTIDSNRRSHFM